MADEPNPTQRRRKESAPRVIEGSAKVIAEEPVENRPADAKSGPASSEPAAAGPAASAAPAAEEPKPTLNSATTVGSAAATDAKSTMERPDETGAADSGHLRGDPDRVDAASLDSSLDKASDTKTSTGASQDDLPPSRRARPVKTRRRWWAYALGGVSIGAGLMAIAWFGPFGSSGPTPLGVDPQLLTLDSKLDSSRQNIATLEKRLAAVEAGLQQLASRQKELQAMVAADADKLADTNKGLADATNTAKAAVAAAQTAQTDAAEAHSGSNQVASTEVSKPVDLKPLQDRIAKLEAALAQPKVEGKSTADPVVSPDGNTASLDHAAALAVVSQTLIQAIDRGETFPRQVAAMETLGAEPSQLAVLKPLADSGVSTVQSLSRTFADLAKTMAPSEPEVPKSGDFLGRIWQQTTQLVRVRPIGRTAGEAGAWAGQIEAALARSDAAGALAEWEKLPQAAKDLSQKWAEGLRSRVAATAAASAILTSAIGNLGKPKS